MEILSQIQIPGIVYIGAVCAYMLQLHEKDFQGAQPFFKRIMPNKAEVFYVRLDFVIVPIIGTVFAIYFLEPDEPKTALFAGISWSGTLNILKARLTQEALEQTLRSNEQKKQANENNDKPEEKK